MSDIIRIKRGLLANLPALSQGEMALTTDEERLYVGGTAANIKIPNKDDLPVTVLKYGAKGDGTTDDTTAIQNAINDMAGKGVLEIPRMANPFIISVKLTIPSNMHLRINGTVKLKNASNTDILFIDDATSNILIEGIGTLDGNRSNQTTGQNAGIAINPNNANNIRIKGITITNVRNWPVNILSAYNVIVEGCTFSYSGNSPEFAARCYDCYFVDCLAHHIDDYGFAFYGGIYSSGIIGCISRDNSAGGIEVLTDAGQTDTNHDITIVGNVCYNNASVGIGVEQISNGTAKNYGITVAHNILHHNGQSNSGVGGINLRYCAQVNVIGNIIHHDGNGSAGAFGIRLDLDCSQVIIKDNNIFDEGQGSTAGVAIALNDWVHDIIIEGNVFNDDQGSPTTAYNINGGTGDRVAIRNNIFGPSVGPTLNLVFGTNNTVENNIGVNPIGPLPSPTMIGSGTTLLNPYPYKCKVAVQGGTVSQIGFQVGSGTIINTGLTSGMFDLETSEKIYLVYSVAPTWTWYGK